MRFTGEDREIDLNETDAPEFDAWRWMPVSELPPTIVSSKRQVYVDLLKRQRRPSRSLAASSGGRSTLNASTKAPFLSIK